MTLNVKPAPLLNGLETYKPPGHGAPVTLHLEGNEGQPPPPTVIESLITAGSESVRRYPDVEPLARRLADLTGVSLERVLVTAGGDDAIERAMRSVLAPGRELVLPVPTFEMMDHYGKMNGARIVEVPWLSGGYPLDQVLAAVNDRTAMIVVVSPNSPTGLVATAADLRALSERAPQALLLVDLAYTDFAETDLTSVALELPNAVVVRTLSKAWGLAGLRVGWAAGPPEMIGWMRAVGHPYAVSSPAVTLAAAGLDNGSEQVSAFVDRVRQERDELGGLLTKLGAEVLPSQANFVLACFADGEWVRDGLAGQGIAVRIFPGKEHLEECARITVPGKSDEFDRLTGALRTTLDPQALLFDVDDTLADVTASYRRATVATAAAFGVKVTFDDITEAKAAGNANNDWELTRRLVRTGGVEASLAEVTERFEAFYQGTKRQPGFHAEETLLVDRTLLARLADRIPLGVVTGRPRRDAKHFLENQGILDLFQTVITMDDGPLKPDPAPVRMAMAQLGVDRAWMIGDTPDDIRSARSAGALPLGVVAPADDPKVARPALCSAGAARVLGNLSELERLLP